MQLQFLQFSFFSPIAPHFGRKEPQYKKVVSLILMHYLIKEHANHYLMLIYHFIKVKDVWTSDGQTMCNLTPWLLIPYIGTAILQFQILRVSFVLCPYQFLALKDSLAYPLALSVPLIACLGQVVTFWFTGSLCDVQSAGVYLYKIDMILDMSKLQVLILFI